VSPCPPRDLRPCRARGMCMKRRRRRYHTNAIRAI